MSARANSTGLEMDRFVWLSITANHLRVKQIPSAQTSLAVHTNVNVSLGTRVTVKQEINSSALM